MDGRHWRYYGIYIFNYGAMGALFPLIGPYLEGIGFTGAQIGAVSACGTGTAIFAAAFWGEQYNNWRRKKEMIMGLSLLSSAAAMVLLNIKGYFLFLLMFSLLYFFYSPVMALIDAMTVGDGRPLGKIRKYGSLGFAGCNFAASRIASETGLWIIFPLFSLGFAAVALLVLLLKRQSKRRPGGPEAEPGRPEGEKKPDRTRESGQPDRTREKKLSGGTQTYPAQTQKGTEEWRPPVRQSRATYRELFRNRRAACIILSLFFAGGTNVGNNTFFGFLYMEAGGTVAGIGTAFLLMAGSEVFVMAYAGRLSARFTIERVIGTALVISALRMFMYSLCPPYQVLLATFFLQGIVNGIILVEGIRYIAKTVEPRLVSIGIAAYYSLCGNCSAIICQLAGGCLLEAFGGGGVYLFFALYNLAGAAVYYGFGLHREAPGGSGAAGSGGDGAGRS